MAQQKSFIVTRRIWSDKRQSSELEEIFLLIDRIYDDVLKELEHRASLLREDLWYQKALKGYYAAKKSGENLSEWEEDLAACCEAYGFSEYNMHEYVGKRKHDRYGDRIGINIMQKIATAAWKAEEKVFYGTGKKVHYRKVGGSMSFEDKKASSGIIYKPEGKVKKHPHEHVYFNGMCLDLKPIRKGDIWLREAMKHKVKYCRIIRKPCGIHYHYFLQIIMAGEPPIKHKMGKEVCGMDPGVSTMTFDTPAMTRMECLSPEAAKYEKEIKTASTIYERRRRMANPQNYHEDGTVRKDTRNFKKKWNHTRGMQEAVMRLKTAHRKKSEYVKQSGNHLANKILEKVSVLWIEPMDYQALAKRAKDSSRQEKPSDIKQKDGTVKRIHKYKRKKRFGSSILKHAPGAFIRTLENKILRQGGRIYEVNIHKYRASQYDHEADCYEKHSLSERTRKVGGHLVQRDCYSAFLIRHAKDPEHPDREACKRDFKQFLKNQGRMVTELIHKEDPSGNFGLYDFLNRGVT